MEGEKKRKRRILPRIPEELESSRTSLEESREERSSEPARESGSSITTTTTTTKPTETTWNVVITHPTQTTFTCPACGVSYHVYSSLQRHMRDRHKDGKVTWTYVCATCGEEYPDKKKVSAHVTRVHVGRAMTTTTTKKDPKGGAFPCEFCKETFESSRSRSQHVRNQHATAQSARLAEVSSKRTSTDSQPRHWDKGTVEKFIRALFVVGTGSNVEIANQMKTKKTAQNVKAYKLRFLKDRPRWRIEFSHLDPSAAPSDSESDDAAEEPETATEEKEEIKETQPEEEVTAVETEEVTTATEATVETEVVPEQEVTVETETPTEEVTVETETPAKEGAVEAGTPPAEETNVETEATGEAESTVPRVHETTGEPPVTITIAYPLQNSLDCPHCSTHYPGEGLEDLRKHLRENHADSPRDWLYLCAFCVEGMSEEEDAIQHMLRDHRDEIRRLPRSGILQARDRLTGPPGPRHSPTPVPAGSQEGEEEEVPPLPPPIFPPLPPEEPAGKPPPLPSETPPPRKKDDAKKRGPPPKKDETNKKEEEAKKALAEIWDRYTESLKPFKDQDLSEEEWLKFCDLVQALPEELKKIMNKFGQRRGNPTRNWRKRQQRKARREGGNNNNNNNNKTDGKKNDKGKGDSRRRRDDDKDKKGKDDDRRREGRPSRSDDKEKKGKGDDSRRDDRRPPRREDRQPPRKDDKEKKGKGDDHRRRDDRRSPRREDRRSPRSDHRSRDEDRRRGDDRRPPRRDNTSNRLTGRQRKALQAKELQMEYRKNAKRCVEKILDDAQERRQCGIPLGDIHKQMSKNYSEATRGSDRPAWIDDPEREKTDVLDTPFAMEEVRRQLRRLPANSAPGPDGTTYSHWKRLDPEGKMLTVILNICRKAARVPSTWKTSTTVLAYKNKGDEKDLRNWRPICLQNTIYKIYAATIAKRIAIWAIEGDVINTAQKGFLPYEGCFEHIFLLRSCLEDARRKKRKIGVAWLDLENAFGSVPTEHLLGSMEELGLTGSTVEVVRDIYTGSTTRVKIDKAHSEEIQCRRGVKQGCPLSPILFDLALEQLVSGLENGRESGYPIAGEEKVAALAYADDLCLLTDSQVSLQKMLDRTAAFASWAGLKFRPNKCATLMINNRAPRHFVEDARFHMGSGELPQMKWEDHYRYLGCEMGRDPRAETKTAGDKYRKEAEKILASQLTDWQKLDAIRRFIRPKLEYILRTMLPNRSWAKNLDDAVRGMAKKAFRLPRRTITTFFYVPWRYGGLGLPNVESDLDVGWASQVFKFLTSKDPKVVMMCARRLRDTVAARRAVKDADFDEILDFLNSRPDEGEHRKSNDVRSLFSLVRGSFYRLGAKLCYVEGDETNLRMMIGDKLIQGTESRQSSPLLRGRFHQKQLDSLQAAVDQGKSFHSVAKHPSSSEWIGNGKYMSFADYRFAIKGRLNQLPVRTVLKRTKQLRGSIHCRRCRSQPETLAHALNHCRGYMGLIRSRHGEILKRIKKAVPAELGEIYLEQEIPGDPEKNRPDLVIINRTTKKVIVVDVTIPFEGEENSLQAARATKETKYSRLKTWLQTQYKEVEVAAFVVGALGSWDLDNEPVLRMLRIGRNYSRLFRRLCCISAIEGSRKIWQAFCRGT